MMNEIAKADKLGIEVKAQEVSVYRSKMKSAAAEAAGTKTATKTPAVKPVKKATMPAEMNGESTNTVDAAKAVKELVEKYGAETVAGLAVLFKGK